MSFLVDIVLTKTSLSAIRALVYLGLCSAREPIPPRRIAIALGESPTYLAKVIRHLVKAGILRAHRGVGGGVVLHRPADRVTLHAIVEACQGAILGDFCNETEDFSRVCALHQAGAELHRAIVGVLARWTLADFLARPGPLPPLQGKVPCLLGGCVVSEGLASAGRQHRGKAGAARKGPVRKRGGR